MKIYLSTNSIPELQGFPKDQHRSLIQRAANKNLMNPLLWLGYGIIFLGTLMVLPAASIFLVLYTNIALPLGLLIGIIIGGIIGLLSTQILFAALRPTLVRYRSELEQATAPTNNDYFVPHAF